MGQERGAGSDRRRLLFIANNDPWPLHSGLAQRLYHLSTGLARHHDVTLVVMSPDGRRDPFPGSERFTALHVVPYSSCNVRMDEAAGRVPTARATSIHALLHRTPIAVQQFTSRQLADTLRHVVAADRIELVWASRTPFAEQARTAVAVPVVVDVDDVESEVVRRDVSSSGRISLGRRVELARLQRWDRGLATRFAAVVVSNPDDVVRVGGPDVVVVPNGFAPAAIADRRTERNDEVLFVGNLEYLPNVDAVSWFHREVLPAIRRRRPSTRLVVLGRRPRPEVLALHDGDGCIVRADVDDLTDDYGRAGVVVVPIRLGGGTRIKALEAMARGKGVVATTIGVEGLDVRAGVDYLRADTPEAFADACVALLGDPDRRRVLGEAARRRVTATSSWHTAVDAALDAVARALSSHEGVVTSAPAR